MRSLPAQGVLASPNIRWADTLWTPAAGKLKNVLATYNEAEDLINIGAYKSGSNPKIRLPVDQALQFLFLLCKPHLCPAKLHLRLCLQLILDIQKAC